MFAAICGGYPFGPLPNATDSFAEARARRASGDSTPEEFQAAADAWVTEIVAEQARHGLSMVTDGWARWRAETPTDLARELLAGAVTPEALVAAWHWADDGIDALVKQVLPGPWSAARDLAAERHPGASPGDAAVAADRRAIARELLDVLVAAGLALRPAMLPVLQLDEPGIPSIGTDETLWEELGELHAELAARVTDLHLSLAITGGAAHPAGHAHLATLPVQSILVDVRTAGAGVDAWRLIHSLPPEMGVIVGAADAGHPTDDDPEMLVWAGALAAESNDRGHIRVGVATSGSMVGLPRRAAARKVEALGTAMVLGKLGPIGQVVRALQADPATCPIRSLRALYADHLAALAALGRSPEETS
jgi:methionine synthase II (cobalamin-independent)